MENKKIAAVWARVSGPGQTSLPDQVARIKEKLEIEGYVVPPDRILAVHWTSLELFNCDQFLTLATWVKRREISGIGVYDRDRLSCVPAERLAFLAELTEAKIPLIFCQGPPLIHDELGMGEWQEFALTMYKKLQVLRARTGTKDGFYDKVARDRMPSTKHKVFGYQWESKTKLVPSSDWPTIKEIYNMAKAGIPTRTICRELEKRGIPSPTGSLNWSASTVSYILNNVTYTGRYFGLKSSACQPKERRGKTNGNSSNRKIPLSEQVWLQSVEIINPPVTWEEWQTIQERRQRNKEDSSRNGKREYLLRGSIYCGTHRGQRGQPLKFCGEKKKNGSYVYRCQVGGCEHASFSGPKLEQEIKNAIYLVLGLEDDQLFRHMQHSHGNTAESLSRELEQCTRKLEKTETALTTAETKNLMGEYTPSVYEGINVRLKGQQAYLSERIEYLRESLTKIYRDKEAVTALKDFKLEYLKRLDTLTTEEWRNLMIRLNLRIVTKPDVLPELTPEMIAALDRPLKLSDFDPYVDLADVTGDTDRYEATIDIPYSDPERIVTKDRGGYTPPLLKPLP